MSKKLTKKNLKSVKGGVSGVEVTTADVELIVPSIRDPEFEKYRREQELKEYLENLEPFDELK